MHFVGMDRAWRSFISSMPSLQPGTRAYSRFRWWQVSKEPNAAPVRVKLDVPQPQAAELYHSAYGMINWHNWGRQDDLQLERKLGTLDWLMGVSTTLLKICTVDTWYAYSQFTNTQEKQKVFYSLLAKELIDNKYDTFGSGGSGWRNRPEDSKEAQVRLVTNNADLVLMLCPPKESERGELELSHRISFRVIVEALRMESIHL
jgi:hypothetical protein